MKKNRVSIPSGIKRELHFRSRSKCYCGARGDQLHHLDENPSNNDFDNLVLLCFEHHDDASVKNGLRARPDAKTIKRLRDEHYARIQKGDRLKIKNYGKLIKTINQDSLYRAAFEASLTTELVKIRYEFRHEHDTLKQEAILGKLDLYDELWTVRLFEYFLNIAEDVTDTGRSGLTSYSASRIRSIIEHHFPSADELKSKKDTESLLRECTNIGFALAYDAALYSNNKLIMCHGMEILRYTWQVAQKRKMQHALAYVNGELESLWESLNRKDWTDLTYQKDVFKTYKEKISEHRMLLPHFANEDYPWKQVSISKSS